MHQNCWERKTARSTASAERHGRNPVNVTSAKMQGRVAERKREKRGSVHSTKVPNDFLRYHTVRFLRADGLMANSGKTLVYFRGRTRESDVGDRSKPQLRHRARTNTARRTRLITELHSARRITSGSTRHPLQTAQLDDPMDNATISTSLSAARILNYPILLSTPLDKLCHGLIMRDSNSSASNGYRDNLVTQLTT